MALLITFWLFPIFLSVFRKKLEFWYLARLALCGSMRLSLLLLQLPLLRSIIDRQVGLLSARAARQSSPAQHSRDMHISIGPLNLIKWAPLNGIMVNGINWLMGSNLTRFTCPKLLFYIMYRLVHLLYVITWLMIIDWPWPKVITPSGFHCFSKPIIYGSELIIEVRPVRVPILYKYADVNSAISNIGM